MRAGSLLFCLVALTGCATLPSLTPGTDPVLEQRTRQTLAELFPRGKRLTQRAVVNAAGRQFSCDGLAQVAADGGIRLALLAPMGVITELRVQPDGTTEVVKTAPGFRESWARQYVATTARLLFATDVSAWRFGRLVDGRPVLWREMADGTRWLYVFSADGARWQEAEIVKGRAQLWHVVGTPSNLHVSGPCFELELRTTDQ